MLRRHLAVSIVALAFALVLAACVQVETGARARFGMIYSCPDDRVQVKPRTDLQWGALRSRLLPEPANVPDPEVAADPARLAKWQEVQTETRARKTEAYNDFDVFEVEGCGHKAFLGCLHPRNYRGGVISDAVLCDSPAEVK